MGNIRYIGFKENSDKIYRDSIEKILSIPYFDLIFTSEEIANYGSFKQNKYHYQLIDYSGEKKILQIGKFQLIEISPDVTVKRINNGVVFDKSRDIIFIDTETKELHTFKSIEPFDDFIDKELWPLIKELNAVQDWNMLIKYRQIPILENEILTLKKRIEDLEKLKVKS